MIISYLGHSCFKLRGRQTVVLTDPYDRETFGRTMEAVRADIVTISHAHHDHNDLARVKDSPFIIQGPGEYEIKGVSIWGISSFHDKQKGSQRGKNTLYVYHLDDLKICHLGDLGHQLDDDQIEQIGDLDILMVPVGGIYTLNAKEAVQLVNQLEPKIIIPMHYQTKELKMKLGSVEGFLEEIGEKTIKPVKSINVIKSLLPEEERQVVWLKS